MGNEESSGQRRWASPLAQIAMAFILVESVTGLAITFGPFHPTVQWGLLIHTVIGVAFLVPVVWYGVTHWLSYRKFAFTHVVLLGYVAALTLLVCLISGLVVTWEGLFLTKMSQVWRYVHLISTIVIVISVVPHVVLLVPRAVRKGAGKPIMRYAMGSIVMTAVGIAIPFVLAVAYPGTQYVNEFPEDYSYVYGVDRPFAPSLAKTSTGGAFDSRSLSNSESCGTSGCHSDILAEWKPSAHRYSAMDTAFLAIQDVMAKQNGPETTRYCGGCHDPISLFSGTKNIFVDDLTGLAGYNEGISCLSCHSIRETDLQGNANYVMDQPSEYLWQWSDEGTGRVARDFLIRTYPAEHNKLSKRMFKTPDYCAACHKQFIDQELNQVGWVQLQNQYDNWKASHWYHEGDPTKTIECRECHMPLVPSTDPASGDSLDYNRTPDDGMHRSHRFIASNQLMPTLLQLEGWEEQVALTEKWLEGKFEIPEIADKWAEGPIVKVALEVPEQVAVGEQVPIRVMFTSNKVGHDYPTGPLDIIQSWLELEVRDDAGNVVFSTGTTDDRHFIEEGSFMFKAEPVDQYGNVIDRHNLWEMVGVRFRRALFPGYTDSVEYKVDCPGSVGVIASDESAPDSPTEDTFVFDSPDAPETLHVTAVLWYRKVDQYLINFLFGEDANVTSPIVEVDRTTATIQVVPSTQ